MAPTHQSASPSPTQRPSHSSPGRACVYARVSGESDPRTLSLDTQAKAEIAPLVAAGFHVEDADVRFERFSGIDSLADRDVLLEIRDLVEAGYYQAFAVHDPDRLVRGVEVFQVVQQIEAAGCQVWINGRFSEPSDERDLLLILGGWASKKEARQILERTSRVRKEITDRGEWYGGGPRRYGLRFDLATRRRVREEPFATVVRRIFDEVAAGMSTHRVAAMLNAEGVRPPFATLGTEKSRSRRGTWTASAVNRIIREESYLGKAYINRYRYVRDDRGRVTKKGGRKLREPVPRSEWVEVAQGKTDQLVEDELWHRANAALSDRNSRKGKIDDARQQKHFYLLRGLLHCGDCRRRMYCGYRMAGVGKARFDTYYCAVHAKTDRDGPPCPGHTVGALKVERQARPILDAMIADPEFIASSIALAYAGDDEDARLRREADRAAESLDRLGRQLDGYAGDLNDPDLGDRARKALRGQMQLIETQIEAMERHRAGLSARLSTARDRDLIRAMSQERCERIRARLAAKQVLEAGDYRLFMEGFGIKFFHAKGGKLEVECQPGLDCTVADQSSPRRHHNGAIVLHPLKLDLTSLVGASS